MSFGLFKTLNSVWDLFDPKEQDYPDPIGRVDSEMWYLDHSVPIQCSFKNWHKSKMAQVILDSKTFKIWVNLIEIKFFEKLGTGMIADGLQDGTVHCPHGTVATKALSNVIGQYYWDYKLTTNQKNTTLLIPKWHPVADRLRPTGRPLVIET